MVNLAILGDSRANWRPTEYVQAEFGCETRFRFRTVKLLDWEARSDELAASSNPIALIVRSRLQSLRTHGDLSARYGSKSRILRELLHLGLEPQQIRELYRLIDWLLELPDELQESLRFEIHKYAEDKLMPFLSSFERLAMKEGEIRNIKENLEILLQAKFGEPGQTFASELHSIENLSKLQAIFRAAVSASTLDELRELAK